MTNKQNSKTTSIVNRTRETRRNSNVSINKPNVETQNRSLFSAETIQLVRQDQLKTFSAFIPNEENSTSLRDADSSERTNRSQMKNCAVHRLVFPQRLGRLKFVRDFCSENDIQRKMFGKDREIEHNVFHLDTIRNDAMEFFMLTTYGSDSQLQAWFDTNGEEILNQMESQENELLWCPDNEQFSTEVSFSKVRTNLTKF